MINSANDLNKLYMAVKWILLHLQILPSLVFTTYFCMQLPSLDEVTLFKAADFVLFFAIHGDFYNGSFVHRNKQAN